MKIGYSRHFKDFIKRKSIYFHKKLCGLKKETYICNPLQKGIVQRGAKGDKNKLFLLLKKFGFKL